MTMLNDLRYLIINLLNFEFCRISSRVKQGYNLYRIIKYLIMNCRLTGQNGSSYTHFFRGWKGKGLVLYCVNKLFKFMYKFSDFPFCPIMFKIIYNIS